MFFPQNHLFTFLVFWYYFKNIKENHSRNVFSVMHWLYMSSDCRLTLWDAFQVVTTEGEAQGFVWFAMQLSIISMAIPLGPISHLQVQHLESRREYVRTLKNIYISLMFVADLLCHESLKPEALAHSKMAEEFYIRYMVFGFFLKINCKTLLARTKHNKIHDTDSLPFTDWRKYDTEFITPSSLQQTSTLISVTLPHSLTSSQGQSEDQFLLKSPAPPLASAPAGILGSWPLPPPPGRCWYDCGSERLLVGRLEWIKKWTTVTFRGH